MVIYTIIKIEFSLQIN